MTDTIYQELYGQVELEGDPDEYEEGEMEMISRKIFSFLSQASEESQKDASKKIGVCIYLYADQDGVLSSRVPYQGKVDNRVRDITFDLKNIPPILGRCIAQMIDETDFESG